MTIQDDPTPLTGHELPDTGYGPLCDPGAFDWIVVAPALARLHRIDDGGTSWAPAVAVWEHLRRIPPNARVDLRRLALAWPLSLTELGQLVGLLERPGLVQDGRVVRAALDGPGPGALLRRVPPPA